MVIELIKLLKTKHLLLLVGLGFLFPLSSFAQTQVFFEWQPNTEPDLAGYRLFSRIDGQDYNYSEPAWEGAETACTIDIADEGARYYFVARAVDTEGFESLDSDEACYGCSVNVSDDCPSDPDKSDPGVCGCGVPDVDTDTDGTLDCNDNCPNDPEKADPGICGCNVPDIDSDGDGTSNCIDNCPNDPEKADPGICGCNVSDIDSDGDGTSNCIDNCPDDAEKITPGVCGCGLPDNDMDEDGLWDCYDTDDDNDGIDDTTEANGPNQGDANRDGILDSLQCNVCSTSISESTNYISIESSEGTCISNFKQTDTLPSEDFPQDVYFIYGLHEYDIRNVGFGNDVIITITLPQGASPDTFYAHGKTPNNPTDHWYEFLDDGETGADINENIITLYLADALRGDNIVLNDGMVMHIGGPGFISTGTEKINNPGAGSIPDGENNTEENSGCFVGCLPQ